MDIYILKIGSILEECMKSDIWNVDGQDRWEWENTGKIQVYGLSDILNNDIEQVIRIIAELINEFNLPLSVLIGETGKDDLVQLLKQCSDNNEIDFNYLEEELNRRRRKSEFFPYGVVIIVNDSYLFKQPKHEKAIYGSATNEGLIVIKREYIDKAMKHELGHMIGIWKHHPHCVMHESCNIDKFCEECRDEIKDKWQQ